MADATAHGERDEAQVERTPFLEWVAGAIGAILTLTLIGFLGWQAWSNPGDVPPDLTVRLEEVLPAVSGDAFTATIRAT